MTFLLRCLFTQYLTAVTSPTSYTRPTLNMLSTKKFVLFFALAPLSCHILSSYYKIFQSHRIPIEDPSELSNMVQFLMKHINKQTKIDIVDEFFHSNRRGVVKIEDKNCTQVGLGSFVHTTQDGELSARPLFNSVDPPIWTWPAQFREPVYNIWRREVKAM